MVGAASPDSAHVRGHGGPGGAVPPSKAGCPQASAPRRGGLSVHRPPRKIVYMASSSDPAGGTGSGIYTQYANLCFSTHRCRSASHRLKYSPRPSSKPACAPGCQRALISLAGVTQLLPYSENYKRSAVDPSTHQYYCKEMFKHEQKILSTKTSVRKD